MVTLSFFKYETWQKRWWAFRQMGIIPNQLKYISGLQFSKLLGSGGNNGFSIFPNFGLYGLLCVWENKICAQNFFKHHDLFKKITEKSVVNQTIVLQPLVAHGLWDGVAPFGNPKEKSDGVVAVITRAKIKLSKLLHFWRFVRSASNNMSQKDGMIFSVGIGELPLIQQATFSIWENTEKMVSYAYKSEQHKKVIQKTRELGWYSEELFARFAVVEVWGEGIIPLFNPLLVKSEG
jgi:hypothetical protein